MDIMIFGVDYWSSCLEFLLLSLEYYSKVVNIGYYLFCLLFVGLNYKI